MLFLVQLEQRLGGGRPEAEGSVWRLLQNSEKR